MRHTLEQRVAETIECHGLVASYTDKIFIAISGGADSVALLVAMIALGYKERLEALHCNFSLRSDESDEDEAFVSALCERYHIPLHVKRFDTRAYAQQEGISIEMAARSLRYGWFSTFHTEGKTVIAVAHNADDQIETLLLNLSMGTGIRGLSGMPFIKPQEGIIRPLQTCPRSLILSYLRDLKQDYREDSSNEELQYKRNLIRHRLIPLFEELNPSFRGAALRTIDHLRSTEALYLECISRYRDQLLSEDKIELHPLLHHPERRALLFELLRPYGFKREVIMDLEEHLKKGGETGRKFHAPRYTLYHGAKYLELLPREEAEKVYLSIEISSRGSMFLPFGGKLSWEVRPIEQLEGGVRVPPTVALFDYNRLRTTTLIIRSREEGDALRPYGMKGKKLLRRIFIDGKYTHQERREALLLCKGETPLWLVGHIADSTYALGANTRQVLRLVYTP